MAQCVEFKTVTASNTGSVIDQPVLTASSSDIASCPGYVLVTPQEYSSMNSSIFVPLSITDGAAIALGIAALWGLAFAYRNIGRFISPSTNED